MLNELRWKDQHLIDVQFYFIWVLSIKIYNLLHIGE